MIIWILKITSGECETKVFFVGKLLRIGFPPAGRVRSCWRVPAKLFRKTFSGKLAGIEISPLQRRRFVDFAENNGNAAHAEIVSFELSKCVVGLRRTKGNLHESSGRPDLEFIYTDFSRSRS